MKEREFQIVYNAVKYHDIAEDILHIHFLSSDKTLEIGNYVYDIKSGNVSRLMNNDQKLFAEVFNDPEQKFFKIVASSDLTLVDMAKIPQSFINKFKVSNRTLNQAWLAMNWGVEGNIALTKDGEVMVHASYFVDPNMNVFKKQEEMAANGFINEVIADSAVDYEFVDGKPDYKTAKPSGFAVAWRGCYSFFDKAGKWHGNDVGCFNVKNGGAQRAFYELIKTYETYLERGYIDTEALKEK